MPVATDSPIAGPMTEIAAEPASPLPLSTLKRISEPLLSPACQELGAFSPDGRTTDAFGEPAFGLAVATAFELSFVASRVFANRIWRRRKARRRIASDFFLRSCAR